MRTMTSEVMSPPLPRGYAPHRALRDNEVWADLPLRDRNELLEAAGFVAAYRDVPLEAPEAASLRRAIDLMLGGIEPNGAVACDRAWNLLQANRGAARLLGTFIDLANAPPARVDGPFVTVHLKRGGVEARLFTTIATIGTAIDATAEDIRIETYFPADEETASLVRSLATSAS